MSSPLYDKPDRRTITSSQAALTQQQKVKTAKLITTKKTITAKDPAETHHTRTTAAATAQTRAEPSFSDDTESVPQPKKTCEKLAKQQQAPIVTKKSPAKTRTRLSDSDSNPVNQNVLNDCMLFFLQFVLFLN